MRIAIIPAKGTSQRVPGKNIRPFLGKPIIAYSIETARASGLFDKVYVSTRDPAVTEVAKALKAPIIVRPFDLSEINQPDCGTQEVTRHGIEWVQKSTGKTVRHACCIYPCAPLMTAEDLIRGFASIQSPGIAYCHPVDHMGNDAGAWYWGHAAAFLGRVPLTPELISRWAIPMERAIDINTEDDWARAEAMYRKIYPTT